MEGLLRNTTVKRLSRRCNSGYEPLDEAVVKSSTAKVHDVIPRWRSMSFRRKKVTDFPLWTREDEAKQRRQIFINSYKFETADESQKWVCSRRKLNEVTCKVKTSVAKLVLSFLGFGSLRSCNCRLAIQASSPTPRSKTDVLT